MKGSEFMIINGNLSNNRIMQGNFSNSVKGENKKGEEGKNSTSSGTMNRYSKMIENIEEQMKKVQENEQYDVDTKKAKMKELQKQIEDIRKMEQEEKAKKLNSINEKKEEKPDSENIDGDKLTLSDEMKDMIKSDVEFDKLKDKNSLNKKLKGSARVLESEIEIDKGRGANTERKEEQLSELKEKIESMDNNELEKMTGTENSINSNRNIKKEDNYIQDENDLEEDKQNVNEIK